MFLKVMFSALFVFLAIASLVPNPQVWAGYARWVLVLLLLGILGWQVFSKIQ
jgi:hypothetical protein